MLRSRCCTSDARTPKLFVQTNQYVPQLQGPGERAKSCPTGRPRRYAWAGRRYSTSSLAGEKHRLISLERWVFVSTVGRDQEVIRDYIKKQREDT